MKKTLPVLAVLFTGICSQAAQKGVLFDMSRAPQKEIPVDPAANLHAALAGIDPSGEKTRAPEHTFDVVVYGGTSAGVTAAVQAKRMGKSVVIVGPDRHLGGLSSGGLGWTDTGNKAVIGGLAREFYHRIWKHYQKDESWRQQKREEYGGRGQGTPAIDGAQRTMWIFEPHAAEQAFEDFVSEYDIPVHRNEWLDRDGPGGVRMKNGRIVSIRMLSGTTYRGKMFIDATYEGDLMAKAGVDYHVGREARSMYDEVWNGVQTGVLHHAHFFETDIDPYVIPGDPSSGLLPRISGAPPGEKGAGDHRIQAYCYRMCLTNVPENRIPFSKPADYDPDQYALLLRVFDTGWRSMFRKFDPIPNYKTDTNNHGPFSTDNIGYNYGYPEGTYDEREAILKEHRTYQQGLMYFMANDPRVPADVRSAMSKWGLAKDEFTDNGGWPHQIYVREARRMVGAYVITEKDCLDQRETPNSVGMGSYTMDSHNVQRYVKPDGYVQNEGDIGARVPRPYEIAYGSLVPKKGQCANLLVPVCVSSSHIAFGSIRMEPVFMILGQSAATAACIAIDDGVSVQKVDYKKLRVRLDADGQICEAPPEKLFKAVSIDPAGFPGVVLDNDKAKLTGHWSESASIKPYVGVVYLHDDNTRKGDSSALFKAALEPGRYEIRVTWTAHENRASSVPIRIAHGAKTAEVYVNQKTKPEIDGLFESLGIFEFTGGNGTVSISNAGTDGYVIVDAVQFLPAKE